MIQADSFVLRVTKLCLPAWLMLTMGCQFDFSIFVPTDILLPSLKEETCVRPTNGCGPAGILGEIVPECPLDGACFTTACGAHDLCYRDCEIQKSSCDNKFLEDMQAICSNRFEEGSLDLPFCNVLAFIYAAAVDRFGNEAFFFTQTIGCACRNAGFARAVPRAMPVGTPLADGAPFVDADDDLLPDEWEDAVGLDSSDPSDAMADYDGDGVIHLVEFMLQTDPFTPEVP